MRFQYVKFVHHPPGQDLDSHNSAAFGTHIAPAYQILTQYVTQFV